LPETENQSSALWIDDRPEATVNERRAFEAVGLQISLALSTEEALARTESQRFALIISNMGRKEVRRKAIPDGHAPSSHLTEGHRVTC
jgi:ActR/RegA family two-component response regulator